MLAGLAVSSMPAGLGLAHCATVSKWAAMGLCGMRSWLTACRRRVGVSSSASPLRVAVRSRFAVVSCPKCRPPRRKTLKTGCYGRSGLRFERIGTCHSALLAREPAIASVTRYVARKPAIWSVGGAAHARISGSTCGLEGRRADWRVGACVSGPTCEMLGAHVTELIHNGSPCCSGRDCAGSDGRRTRARISGPACG